MYECFYLHHFEFSLPETPEWFIGDQVEGLLKTKIETHTKLLKEFNVRINFGIKTVYNQAFIIDEQKKDELTYLDPKSADSADITALESQIDQLVYQLYDLTPEEIVIIEESVK